MAHPHVLDVAALCRAVQQARHHATTEALFTYAGAFKSLRETVLHEIQRRLEKEDVPRSMLGQSREASQGDGRGNGSAPRLGDRWLSPRECASRLCISDRTL